MTPLHFEPNYHGYIADSFDNVNYCQDCQTHALYEDMHSVNPCPVCGGKIIEKEIVGKWIKPVYCWVFIFGFIPLRKLRKQGYWKTKRRCK